MRSVARYGASKIALAVLCLGGTMAQAHNGAVALAHPASDIIIDGALTDWPSDIPSYPIEQAQGLLLEVKFVPGGWKKPACAPAATSSSVAMRSRRFCTQMA